MVYLLDVNVLIALADPAHVQHEAAHGWFGSGGAASFATCPLTENGLLRIVGNHRYPNSPGTPAAAAGILVPMLTLGLRLHETDLVEIMTFAAAFSVARLALALASLERASGPAFGTALTMLGTATFTALAFGTALTAPFPLAFRTALGAIALGAAFAAPLERLAIAVTVMAAVAALALAVMGTVALRALAVE